MSDLPLPIKQRSASCALSLCSSPQRTADKFEYGQKTWERRPARIAVISMMALALALFVGCVRPKSQNSGTGQLPAPPPIVRTNSLSTDHIQLRGRVDRINAKGGHVVISFPIGWLPAVDSRLNIYRNNVKVAEVKVTPPQQNNLTAADIIAGECQLGDEAWLE